MNQSGPTTPRRKRYKRSLQSNASNESKRESTSRRDLGTHICKWRNCKLCEIGSRTTEHVFFRGDIPCDWLFVGEAPGENEDLVGEPFVGRSGQLLNSLIDEVIETKGVKVAFTNTVLCTPWDENKEDIGRPSKQNVKNCNPRLLEFIDIAKPQLIIAVGKEAKSALTLAKLQFFHIVHPAFMLRRGGENSVEYVRTRLQLRQILQFGPPYFAEQAT